MKIVKGLKILGLLTSLVLSMVLAISVSSCNAQAITIYRPYLYVTVGPKVVGVNQYVLIIGFTAEIPPDIGEQEGRIPGFTRAGWDNIRIDVIRPDGRNDTITIRRTDPVGAFWATYTPTIIGTYAIQAYFPGQWKNTTTLRRYYRPDVSNVAYFTVQETPIQEYQEPPLPVDYWTRPIYAANRMWYQIASHWLSGTFQVWPPGASGGVTTRFCYGKGPESPHILWTRPYWAGGIMEERFGIYSYQTAHYQGISVSPIILQGKIFVPYRRDAHGTQGYMAIDLYTGELLWYRNESMPTYAQVYNYDSPNQHGGFLYLWRTTGVNVPTVIQVPQARRLPNGTLIREAAVRTINRTTTPVSLGTVWEMLDGYTGYTICYVANVSTAGTLVYGKRGDILRYNIVNYGTAAAPKYYLTCWNLSDGTMVASTQPPLGTGAWQWRPAGGHFGAANPFLGAYATNYVHDGRDFFTLNVSIPDIRKLSPILNQTGSILAIREGEYIIIGAAGRNDERGLVEGFMMTLSLKKGEEGKQLAYITFKPPFVSYKENATVSLTGVYPEYGVFCFHSTRLLKRWGYSLATGECLWESVPEEPLQYYGMYTNVYNGLLLSSGYSGQLRAYNITTGKIVWMYNATGVGYEGFYGGCYTIGIAAICDGKIYTVASEHSPTQPLWRGPNLRCIDAKTGKEIWSILFWGAGMSPDTPNVAMADGILVALNYFDMQLYAFGKGPSATTVSAPQEEIPLGSSVIITGTVTDQSPSGRRNTNGILDFTLKGTPAIADECMGKWMEYLFMQQAYPSDIRGVDVTLDAIDPTGEYIHLGKVTCDATGKFAYTFKPEKQGTYKIIATFEGSASYGPSFATTYLYVGPPPKPAATPEQAQTLQSEVEAHEQLLTTLLVLVVIAIIISVGNLAIIFRKIRK